MKKPGGDNVNANVKKGREGRKRRATGWTLLTLGVLVAGVWTASGWWAVSYQGAFRRIDIVRGHVRFVARSNLTLSEKGGWDIAWAGNGDYRGRLWWWWYGWRPNGCDYYGIVMWEADLLMPWGSERASAVTLWPIPLLLWTPAALLLRSGILAPRRAKSGACPECGYSLAGLGDAAACSECGKTKAQG